MGGPAIDTIGNRPGDDAAPRLCLVFAPGSRPDLAALDTLAGEPVVAPETTFALTHRATDGSWAELLASGLSFDCRGLSPGPDEPQPPAGPTVGLRSMPAGEVVSLAPGPHLAGGVGLLPVLRLIAGVGARLAGLKNLQALVWSPAGAWVAPDLFRKAIAEWLGGGAFPGLVLTGLQREANGAMISRGLGLLIGQELRFEPDKRLPAAAMARIAVRLIHDLVLSGPLHEERDFAGPGGEQMLVVPTRGGSQLRILLSAGGASG